MINSAIPSEMGQLTNLKELSLENNRLTSTVPLELQNIRLWGERNDVGLNLAINVFCLLAEWFLPNIDVLASEFVYLEGNSLRGDLDPVFCPLEGPNIDVSVTHRLSHCMCLWGVTQFELCLSLVVGRLRSGTRSRLYMLHILLLSLDWLL